MTMPLWLCLDIETVGRDDVADYIERETLDLGAIKPDGRISKNDPEKLAASVAERRAAAVADAEQKYAEQVEKCALDWNANRIVAIGLQTEEDAEPRVLLCRDEAEEADALRTVWRAYAGQRTRRLVSFNGAGFDVPTLIQRSRFLRVPAPRIDQRKYGNSDQVDLYRLLTFDDSQRTFVIRRTLGNFCRLFDLNVPDDPCDGGDIARLVAEGDWTAIAHHVQIDVVKTVALARRLDVIAAQAAREAVA